MAKHILSAFIQQTVQFDTRTDFEIYAADLKRGKIKFSISDKKTDDDGKITVTVRKQYNNNYFPDESEGGEK